MKLLNFTFKKEAYWMVAINAAPMAFGGIVMIAALIFYGLCGGGFGE